MAKKNMRDRLKSEPGLAAEFAAQGGKARASTLSKKQRQEIARAGGLARQAKRRASLATMVEAIAEVEAHNDENPGHQD